MGLSQRALGALFQPAVTTQFVSNIERGVTPLPPTHVHTLARALLVSEEELLTLLEKEYASKLSGRVAHAGEDLRATPALPSALPQLVVPKDDFDFLRKLCDSYRQADPKTRQAFASVCESLFHWSPRGDSDEGSKSG